MNKGDYTHVKRTKIDIRHQAPKHSHHPSSTQTLTLPIKHPNIDITLQAPQDIDIAHWAPKHCPQPSSTQDIDIAHSSTQTLTTSSFKHPHNTHTWRQYLLADMLKPVTKHKLLLNSLTFPQTLGQWPSILYTNLSPPGYIWINYLSPWK
jgi:hypothetical protein